MPTDLPDRNTRKIDPIRKTADAIVTLGCSIVLAAPAIGLVTFCVVAGYRLATALIP